MIKALLIVNDDLEEIEALATRDLLLRAQIQVITYSLSPSKILTSSNNLVFTSDLTSKDTINVDEFAILIIPGGKYIQLLPTKYIKEQGVLLDLIARFNASNKYVAAICAAPSFLAANGYCLNKTITHYPTTKILAQNAKKITDLSAVSDELLITGRSVGAVFEFSFEIVKQLLSSDAVTNLKKVIAYE
jgi:4-methyl-5(b-hydroxyethyl)-thiazole monophosphate biosynthesis